ncbi:putative cAMP-dependent protein kinase pathway protein (Som1) [Aspergillus brunneoviolaceus CBS 621.78]|uniref:Uncharacterized protein n=1 Tax=Aspergillus brunneoviolaceus CBS 621.78 TaxID=1450534 RepID=A0ACD1GJQ2_9EURO|nr:hypothetical protein BO95DRAFT_508141 [Aspergillus brunneoviolaceus CBS 621.78]RAH49482.1 hypothetical protein BO95DRAFT_508141 [Aspergillus brunneoviolaceus CBS 621.78]
MNQMNVAGMNPGAGGPVGGVPIINNGSAAPRNDATIHTIPESTVGNLNTFIYDYFLKRGYYECARALVKDESVKLNTEPPIKTSPGHRRDGDVNGVDGDAMMTDAKDGDKKIPDDLPRPHISSEGQQSSFLLEWFSLFWEFFWAQRKKGNSADVRQYLNHTQNIMRLREQHQNQLLRQQPLMPGQMGQMNIRRNGMVPQPLQKTALQNNTPGLTQQQLQQFQKNQHQQLQMMQMTREHSDIDMNGHRPQSPSSAENAPSPSKRPRLEGGLMNGQQLAPNGRAQVQGMPGQPNPQAALLMQNGLNRAMNPNQFQAFPQSGPAAQQKSIQVYAQNLAIHHSRSAMNNQGMPNGMINPGVMQNQTDMVSMPDGQVYPINGDYYGANGQMAQVRNGMQTPGGQPGNHALQDYQMQLMLLEQQNKRRLMMARQEQDSMARPDGQPPLPGQPGLQPGTSPQGSRAGTSPNPNDQMKRGTPKMPQTGLPGSPSAGDAMAQGRGSPASMNFGNQIPPEMAGQFFVKGIPDGMTGPNGMRPPSSNPAFSAPQMGQPIPAGAGNRVPSGNWQPQQGAQQPMAPQQSPATQPQSTGTPQERNAMPPPQAPPAAGANTGRTQPPSPQTAAAAPPTPQQANKPAPKKKEAKDTRKRPSKKATTAAAAAAASANAAATPSSEAEHPPTPTPSTPITPQHPASFNKAGANVTTSAPQQPTSAPAPQPLVQPPPDQGQQFGELGVPDPQVFNLDFSALENPDILENFDFDTFLNTDADTAGFGFDPNISYPTDGVETGAGDGL